MLLKVASFFVHGSVEQPHQGVASLKVAHRVSAQNEGYAVGIISVEMCVCRPLVDSQVLAVKQEAAEDGR